MNYNQLASKNSLNKTTEALRGRGYEVVVVRNGIEALAHITTQIPPNVSVMNGSSVTLEQIGYVEYLKSGKHPWIDLHAKITAEHDEEKRSELRKQSVLSAYYLGSVHALVETGEYLVASNTASQLPHIAYTSPNLIFVVSTKKIVPTIEEGMKRLKEHVIPLEDTHMLDLYKMHTVLNKILIVQQESTFSTRNIRFILVEEDLGF